MTPSTFILAAMVVAAPAATHQPQSVPDLSGIWKRKFQISETFEPPASGPGPIVQDPRYPATNHEGVPRRALTAEERSHVIRFTQDWVPDTSNPILQPRTKQVLERIGQQELAGKPHPELQTRCLPSGTPSVLNSLDNLMVVQSPTEVLFLYERDHHFRHVYLNQPHSLNPVQSWWGESVGHYEGDTLVVDTIGQNNRTEVDRFGTPHSDLIHVVERYRRTQDGRGIEVRFTVDDPIAFTEPWSGQAHYGRAPDGKFLEIACAESQHIFWPGREIEIPSAKTRDF